LNILFDTNVLLDAIAAREPFRQDAERIVLMVAEEKIEGFVSAKSVADIYYVARKHMPEKVVREVLRNLFLVFSILPVFGEDCQLALESPLGDYEDAILAACGHRSAMKYIISRDEDFLKSNTLVPTLSPDVFLRIYSK
jgi:predicted nucleic acid-binding protein